jgi:hypothetical protein
MAIRAVVAMTQAEPSMAARACSLGDDLGREPGEETAVEAADAVDERVSEKREEAHDGEGHGGPEQHEEPDGRWAAVSRLALAQG